MPETYTVSIDSSREIHKLPGSWTPEVFRRVVTLAEFEEINQLNDADLDDMSVMVIQDLGNQKGGEQILWHFEGPDMDGKSGRFQLIGSNQWFGAPGRGDEFSVSV